MAVELTFSNYGPLEFKPGLPPDYAGPVLKGAIAVSTQTNLANLVLQELTGENYSIRFLVGRFLKRVYASGWIHSRGLYGYFMLKNGTHKQFDSIGRLHLRQDQYGCFFTESTDCNAVFEKNKEFRAIDFFYSPKLLEELLPFFPELKEVLSASPGKLLTNKANWILPSMKETINQILNCPYDESVRQLYFDLKVREVLLQILERAFKHKPIIHFFTPWEVAKIHEAREILKGYISKKPPSIKSLARQVALNEYKLKVGFRQYFDAGVLEWLAEQKLQYSKELILTTNKPIKDICKMVGYPLTTNFITAFRRHFGVTPGSFRRK